MSTKFHNSLQMSHLQMRSELNCKKYNWVMKSFANETRLICTWVRYWFICKWVLTSLQTRIHLLIGVLTHMQQTSHISFANEPFPPHFFCSTSCHNDLLPKNISHHIKKTHTTHTTSHMHQKSSTRWCCSLLQWHGCGKPVIPTPGSLFGRGRVRAVIKGFI